MKTIDTRSAMDDPTMRSESRRNVGPEEPQPDPPLRELEPETPEADAIEQRQAVVGDSVEDELETMPAEASEADALEQARIAPIDDASPD
jgi:hypothetical protein